MKQQKEKGKYFIVAPDVWGMKDIFVNIYMIRNSEQNDWVLVDTGLKTSAGKIKKMAAALFGENSTPSAIILTHGHFDHRGSALQLAKEWHVPVYAHFLEMPYLMGISCYPPPDPTVGGGLMAWMSFMYPKQPININHILHALPDDVSVPGLAGWKYIHTPGHAPGHISLFREQDKVLIAGDAFVTTKQESVLAVMTQEQHLSGPPKYFTYDWEESERSVAKLAALLPETAATGHGKPMYGKKLQTELNDLANYFSVVAVPLKGRYVNEPAVTDAGGVLYVPPPVKSDTKKWAITGAIILGSAVIIGVLLKNRKRLAFW